MITSSELKPNGSLSLDGNSVVLAAPSAPIVCTNEDQISVMASGSSSSSGSSIAGTLEGVSLSIGNQKVEVNPQLTKLAMNALANAKKLKSKTDELVGNVQNETPYEIIDSYNQAIRAYGMAVKLLEKAKMTTNALQELQDLKQSKDRFGFTAFGKMFLSTEEFKHLKEELLDLIKPEDDLSSSLQTVLEVTDKTEWTSYHHFASAYVSEVSGECEEAAETYKELFDRLSDYPEKALSVLSHALGVAPNNSEIKSIIQLTTDVIRMTFETLLRTINTEGSKKPECFICYAWENDVQNWLYNQLIRDLKLAGIKPIFDLERLGAGNSLNDYQDQIRNTETVIVVGTPLIKEKCSKDLLKGVAYEIKLFQGRFNDRELNKTSFPILYKGNRQNSNPALIIEDNIWTDFRCVNQYYDQVLFLVGGLKDLKEETQKIRDSFKRLLQEIISGREIPNEEDIEVWRANARGDRELLMSDMTQLLRG